MIHGKLPALPALIEGLSRTLSGVGDISPDIKIIDRTPNVFESTFPSEVVTCQRDDGSQVKVLCKYCEVTDTHRALAYRGGPNYEAFVYRDILSKINANLVAFHGSYKDGDTGRCWIVLQYLEGGLTLDISPEPDSIVRAASWLGNFHAEGQRWLTRSDGRERLNRYDAGYYSGWVKRTNIYAGGLHTQFPWLKELCKKAAAYFESLIGEPETIVHGEFYPTNILVSRGLIYPIDWETAAIAAGEIDLAALTDEWSEEEARKCELAYVKSRWPGGPPPDFRSRLDIARLYTCFRWLGERPEWLRHEGVVANFSRLRSIAERIGAI